MNDKRAKDERQDDGAQKPALKTWQSPQVTRTRAGDAEASPNPTHHEGPLAFS